jgi:hypothetical protein
MPTPYYIAWWNLENLFDEEGAVALGRRTDKVQRVIGKDIKGWTPSLRDKKISQLASVIAQMNAGAGPPVTYSTWQRWTNERRAIRVRDRPRESPPRISSCGQRGKITALRCLCRASGPQRWWMARDHSVRGDWMRIKNAIEKLAEER